MKVPIAFDLGDFLNITLGGNAYANIEKRSNESYLNIA